MRATACTLAPRGSPLRLEHVDESFRQHPHGGKFIAGGSARDSERDDPAERTARSLSEGGTSIGLQNLQESAFAAFAASARQLSPRLPSRSSRFGVSKRERRLVDQNSASWNPLIGWLRNTEALSAA
jgi:hypothetical protein